jgi:hypothetical protein
MLFGSIKKALSGYQQKQGLHRPPLMIHTTKNVFLVYVNNRRSMARNTFSCCVFSFFTLSLAVRVGCFLVTWFVGGCFARQYEAYLFSIQRFQSRMGLSDFSSDNDVHHFYFGNSLSKHFPQCSTVFNVPLPSLPFQLNHWHSKNRNDVCHAVHKKKSQFHSTLKVL